MAFGLRCTFLCLVTLFIGSTAWAADTIDYTVSVTGVENSELKDAIIGASKLLDKTKRPVPTERALRRRVDASLTRVSALLRTRAFYAAKQRYSIECKSKDSAGAVSLIKQVSERLENPAFKPQADAIRPRRQIASA